MLHRIELTNFKCFEALELACSPFNLLCGLNGMGKSSVIQALLVLRQSFEPGELGRGRLVLGGDRTDLGAGSDVLFEDAEDDFIGFELGGDDLADWAQTFAYSRTRDRLTALAAASDDIVPSSWRNRPPFGGHFANVEAERVGPRKSYPLSEVQARRRNLGGRGEYAWNYLNEHQDDLLPTDDPRRVDGAGRRLVEVVDHWLQHVSPGAHLHLEPVQTADAVLAGFRFDRPGDVASQRHRATNVGFGLSYALPVVLALLMPPVSATAVASTCASRPENGSSRAATSARICRCESTGPPCLFLAPQAT